MLEMILIFFLISAIPVVLIVWAIVELIRLDYIEPFNKIIWALLILFVPVIGSLVFLIIGRRRLPGR